MSVDVQIGTVETVIESTTQGRADSRDEIIALALQAMRAELARSQAEDAQRRREAAVKPRSFGQRY